LNITCSKPLFGGGAGGASISVLMDWKANWHESSISAVKDNLYRT